MCKICEEMPTLNFTEVVNKLLSIHNTLDFDHIKHIAASVLMRENLNCDDPNRVRPEGYKKAFDDLELLREYYSGENYEPIEVGALFSGSLFSDNFDKEIN